MNKLHLLNYNLPITLLGGQDFNWDIINGEYWGYLQNAIIRIKPLGSDGGEKDGQTILWQTYPEKDDFELLREYLNLDEDYKSILENIQIDDHVKKAVKEFPGLRILNQNFEQCTINFISSTNRNLNLIRQSRRLLNASLGKDLIIDGKRHYLFPAVQDIAKTDMSILINAKLGYRAPYVKSAAERLSHNLFHFCHPEFIEGSNDERFEKLQELEGIGPKVADCILTYSCKAENITPLDIWGQRVFKKLYNVDEKLNYKQMKRWYQNYFKRNANYAGQFLFEYVRKYGIK